MRLTYEGLKNPKFWEKAEIELPPYNPEEIAQKTKKNPLWVHFGIGNIFRIFIGGIADKLIRAGLTDRGIICVETFDYDIRFHNIYLGDTSARIAVDISQMVGIRFGETIKAYVSRYGTAKKLNAIPLAIAGWLRYLLAVDDAGNKFELSSDPMIPELRKQLQSIEFNSPETFSEQLKPILSNKNIFGINLYEAGIGKKIENIFRDMLAGQGAVRAALKKYLAKQP